MSGEIQSKCVKSIQLLTITEGFARLGFPIISVTFLGNILNIVDHPTTPPQLVLYFILEALLS